jgi:ABC-type branched-subunit amino acid transport system substrate-binding protein
MISKKMFRLIRRSLFLLSQLILIAAFGCGPAATPIIIEVPTTVPAAAAGTEAVPTQALPTGIPTITSTPFEPRAVIKLFSHVPLTGEQSRYGQDILRGTELAVEHLSGPLNELGYKVELVSYDDQNLTEIARANAQQIVADAEVLCGVGHYDSAVTVAASDVYHLAGLALVAPSTTAPILTDRNYREVNRVIGRADGQGIAAAQFAISKQFATVYIVSQQKEESLRNAEYFRRDSGNLGIQLLGMRVGNVTEENLNQIVSQIMNAKPDLVYISSAAEQAIPFLSELRAAGYTGTFFGTEELDHPDLISQAGASLIEGGGLYYTITTPPTQFFPETEQFIWEYNQKYGEEPLDFAARAYDAAGICLRGIALAIETVGGVVPSRADVTRAIRRLNNYKGLTGTYDFNREGDPDPAPYYVLQVTSVDTTNWAQNPIVAGYEIIPP